MTATATTMLPPPPKRRTLAEIVSDLLTRLDEADGEVTPAIEDIELELQDKVEAYAAAIRKLEADGRANAELAKHYATTAEAKVSRAKAVRERLLAALQAAGKKSLATATATASRRMSSRVQVVDGFVDFAAARFVRVKHEPRLQELKAALEAGEAVEGAWLESSETLTLR